jgi:hypothetical protein
LWAFFVPACIPPYSTARCPGSMLLKGAGEV